jgi:hypothetical protein
MESNKEITIIHIPCVVEFICRIESEDERIDIKAGELDDSQIIVGVSNKGDILPIGDFCDYPIRIYRFLGMNKAYTMRSIRRMHNIQERAEALADELITIYDPDLLTNDLLEKVKKLMDDAFCLSVDPDLTRFKLFTNFLRVCSKRGMGLMHSFHQYTMDMNNCYLLAGAEAGEK